MRLLPISSKNQIADLFTKACGPRVFLDLFAKLGMIDIYHPRACEGVLAQ
uniref:Uncharacterized protein n=1 Tax=Cajanus cajan TaxID=3821 RepID=A0A151TIX3_CAJCA|nr:hypothetical protein KK1_013299 [Cajanus cajan]